MNLLIVEDEKSLANEIGSFLKKEGFLCDLAFTGTEEIGRASCRERV